MPAPRNSPFRDQFGRYAGPIAIKTDYPPSPYADGEHCTGCFAHWLDPHAPGCPHTPPPRWA